MGEPELCTAVLDPSPFQSKVRAVIAGMGVEEVGSLPIPRYQGWIRCHRPFPPSSSVLPAGRAHLHWPGPSPPAAPCEASRGADGSAPHTPLLCTTGNSAPAHLPLRIPNISVLSLWSPNSSWYFQDPSSTHRHRFCLQPPHRPGLLLLSLCTLFPTPKTVSPALSPA